MTSRIFVGRTGSAAACAAAALLLASCGSDLVCASDQIECGGRCVSAQSDAANCGACGNACAAGEACGAGVCSDCASVCGAGRCEAGVCRPDVFVACFATDEVRGTNAELAPAGPPIAVDDGPVTLAAEGGAVWVGNSLGAGALRGLRPGQAPQRVGVAGGDLQDVHVKDGLVYATSSSVDTVVVVDPARGAVIDEVPLERVAGTAANPVGLDFVGDRAYVALYGSASQPSWDDAQQIAVVDFTGERSCASPPCGDVVKTIRLEGIAGAADTAAGAYPFPSRVVRAGTRVFVTLANLKAETTQFGTFYTAPAGSGRLLVVDTGAGDATSIVDLGSACRNPGDATLSGSTLYVACATGVVVPVDTSAAVPAAGPAIGVPPAVLNPGRIASCGDRLYVTDQFSGTVARVDPAGTTAAVTAAVCPVDATAGFAWAADVACGL